MGEDGCCWHLSIVGHVKKFRIRYPVIGLTGVSDAGIRIEGSRVFSLNAEYLEWA